MFDVFLWYVIWCQFCYTQHKSIRLLGIKSTLSFCFPLLTSIQGEKQKETDPHLLLWGFFCFQFSSVPSRFFFILLFIFFNTEVYGERIHTCFRLTDPLFYCTCVDPSKKCFQFAGTERIHNGSVDFAYVIVCPHIGCCDLWSE